MTSASRLRLTIQTEDGRPLGRLIYTNAGRPRFGYVPERFVVTLQLSAAGASLPDGNARLELPPGWLPLPGSARLLPRQESSLSWMVYPQTIPDSYDVAIRARVSLDRQVASVEQRLAVEISGFSQFEPERHGLPWANTVADLGTVQPDREIFRDTYSLSLFPGAFFRGLYGAIVFIGRRGGGYQGGLCTGMARAALERSLGSPSSEAGLMRDILLFHGRQLTDRALLAAAPWFLIPSPRRAFRTFRSDVLARGWSDLCFDIGVPRPWRRDLPTALMREGHTLVPYAFRQSSPDHAEVLVYDPNHPAGPEAERSVVRFDLAGNTYEYRGLARLGDTSTTVIAVRQRAYRAGRTAILASAGSLVLFPGSVGPNFRRWAGRGALALVIGALAGAGAWRALRRPSSMPRAG